MPRKSSKSMKSKPRIYVKTRPSRKYKTVNIVNKSLNPFPQKLITKQKYAETVTASVASGIIGQYNFNLNSVYDPNRTGTGHQPFGYDTLSTVYNRYRVLGCKYNISMISSNSSQVNQITAIPGNEVMTSVSTNAYAREMPRARYIMQGAAGAGAPIKVLKGYVDIASLMGLTKTQYRSNENTQAQIGNNPAELSVLNLFVGSFIDDITTFSGYINIELTYIVEWFDPLQLSQS